ncbi:hypothetical protein H7849_24035 [Alloacidobacterium dinghuense]|uniref:Uncharacterized protein n=1 Tax=Alloacidobacterium dinghuense TaxID=2763107 RepID=A0A7G8BHM1_9BACT|nr:hypothetical protein [Alloacidobacterium dinghuense]QNI32041.1 hypothetical protein H7849_24035 [Alloacidobacterium dinghuense]
MFKPSRLIAALLLSMTLSAFADPAPFDLAGPKVEVRVSRNGKTLPIAKVPNLVAGDRLWIHPVMPPGQSVKYLMVVAFLRGSTNPPPENWFTKAETWDKKVVSEGIFVTVPKDTQQAIVFLAPSTGGDFGSIRDAVHSRPGSFVRASQDLNQLSLDKARLDAYLDAVRAINETNPDRLKDVSPLLARSLSIKLDQDCLQKVVEEQASCLVQKQNELVMDDGHTLSVTDALTTGATSDLAMQLSYTARAGAGYFSPYVASVIDIAHILETVHTAQYQYIPALNTFHNDEVNLKLNTPPSFRNPKSVIVMALPAIDGGHQPPLRPVDEKQQFCVAKDKLALPVEGAPLTFATQYAHDMVLRVKDKNGKDLDIPVKPDPTQGGFVVDTKATNPGNLNSSMTGTLHGMWGFEPYTGPSFHLQNAQTTKWELAATDTHALVVGREDTLHFTSGNATCVDSIMAKTDSGKEIKTVWKADQPDQLEVKVPLKDESPGALTLLINQAGAKEPEKIALHSLSEAGKYVSFTMNAGDEQGVLAGNRLDEVATLDVKGIQFRSDKLRNTASGDALTMMAVKGEAAAQLHAGDKETAHVQLKDGRTLDVPASVVTARPKVQLLSKSVQPSDPTKDTHITLSDTNEVPLNSKLVFSIKAVTPETFSPDQKIEVATADGVFHNTLSLADGSLTLQDSKTALATVDPAKSFGPSAFGPLRFRPVGPNDTPGDWQPLANLVRLPVLDAVQCGHGAGQPCTLTGSNLFLIDSVSADPSFAQGMQVPDGFAGNALQVPHPVSGSLYVKLRDDPSAINTVVVPRKPLPQQASTAMPSAPATAPAPTPATAPVADPAKQDATPASQTNSTTAPQPNTTTAPAQTDQPH